MATSVLCSQSRTEQKVSWNLVVEITWKCVKVDVCCCFWMGRNKLSWWRKTGNVASRGENKDYWDLSVCFACFFPIFCAISWERPLSDKGFNISRISCFRSPNFHSHLKNQVEHRPESVSNLHIFMISCHWHHSHNYIDHLLSTKLQQLTTFITNSTPPSFLKRFFLPNKKDVISYNSVLAACAKASCWKQAVAKPGAKWSFLVGKNPWVCWGNGTTILGVAPIYNIVFFYHTISFIHMYHICRY